MATGTWDVAGLTQLGNLAAGFQEAPNRASTKVSGAADQARGARLGGSQAVAAAGIFADEWRGEFGKHSRALASVGGKLVTTANTIGTADQHSKNEFERLPARGRGGAIAI